ncbi:MAG: hypothetical protein WCX60_06590 [Anaerovoracaceae bacterium]
MDENRIGEWEVEVEDVKFLIRGSYIKGRPAHITADPYYSDPGYGSDIEDYEIYVADSNFEIYNVLKPEIIDKIVDEALRQEEY